MRSKKTQVKTKVYWNRLAEDLMILYFFKSGPAMTEYKAKDDGKMYYLPIDEAFLPLITDTDAIFVDLGDL
jgi:hypothetical protein